MQLTLVCGDLNPSSFVVIFRLGTRNIPYLIKQPEIRLPRISSCFCIRSKQIRTAVNFEKKRDIEITYSNVFFLNHSQSSNIWRKNLTSSFKNDFFLLWHENKQHVTFVFLDIKANMRSTYSLKWPKNTKSLTFFFAAKEKQNTCTVVIK